MKKSVKKVVNRLKPLVGHEIIRIKPAHGDHSYADRPLTLLGFTDKGELIIRDEEFRDAQYHERVLPMEFTDPFWISYKKAQRPKNNLLNQWKGKYIRRIVPIEYPFYDRSFMDPSDRYRLIAASKHHVFLRRNGRTVILNYLYANPKDWTLNE